jgi:hypothetical protein
MTLGIKLLEVFGLQDLMQNLEDMTILIFGLKEHQIILIVFMEC